MLKRLRVSGYKSLRDTEIHFAPLTALIGPNSSGKSNILDAIHLLSRIVKAQDLQDAFADPHRGTAFQSRHVVRGGSNSPNADAEGNSEVTFEVDVELSESVLEATRAEAEKLGRSGDFSELFPLRLIQYRISIEVDAKSGMLRVSRESAFALPMTPESTIRELTLIERATDTATVRDISADPEPLVRRLGKVDAGRSLLAGIPHPLRFQTHHALMMEIASWSVYSLDPRGRMRLPSPVREVRKLGHAGEDLASLVNTLKHHHVSKFRSLSDALHVMIPSVTGVDVDVNDLGEAELFLHEGDTRFSARVASEGTIRLLGMLAIGVSPSPPTLIAIEEPENGMPPKRLEEVVRILQSMARKSQVVVTTHSPDLPDLLPPDGLRLCARRDGATIVRSLDSNESASSSRRAVVGKALSDEGTWPPERVSARVRRGDFDA